MKKSSNYLKEVKKQYEDYPYPQRNPNDEKKRLLSYEHEHINLINHYCFNGEIPLHVKGNGETFRILIAGGGTGDAAIYFAEVLHDLNVEIVYIDMSKSSMKIAKERANIRQLKNIKWINNSLLEISNIGIGEFDYINCSGVLHHLESPTDGLNALKSVLKDNGAMGIMVYAKYGRTGVYQMQELMRKINLHEENFQTQVDNTKTVLSALPTTNWFQRDKESFALDTNNDNGIYDLLLHSQDRAYTVPELYDWVENKCKLNIIEFTGYGVESKMGYNPKVYIKDSILLSKINTFSIIEQKSISELLSGNIKKHTFFISKHDLTKTIASIKNTDLIPYFNTLEINGKEVADIIESQPGLSINFNIANLGSLNLNPTKYTKEIFRLLDGKRSIKEIFEKIEAGFDELLHEFENIFNQLFDLNIILLKSKSTPRIKTLTEAQNRIKKIYNI